MKTEIVRLKYESGWQMIACVCGSVFHASGSMASIDQKRKKWSAKHANCSEKKREGRKVFWLSFCDADLPKGSQFLGVCLIEVTAEEADEAAIDVLLRFPLAAPDAEWLGAAVKKAHRLGCNPGGQVASMEMPLDHPNLARYALGVLMDRATVECIDKEIAAAQATERSE